VTATDEPLVLAAVVPDGAADEAIAGLASQRTFPVRGFVLVAVSGVLLLLLTHQPAWLLLVPAWAVLWRVLRGRVGRTSLRTITLPAGQVIEVEWREREVVVRRPAGTVHFGYDGMEVASATPTLTSILVRDAARAGNRKVLFLPTELVPPEAVARFQAAAPGGEDPFGAARMERVVRVPPGWPRTDYGFSRGHRIGLGIAAGFEVLLLTLLAALGEWVAVAALAVVLVGLVLFLRAVPFREARRRLPPGSLVGVSLTGGRVALALPDQRVDLPEARVRNVSPVGVDIVHFQFTGTNLAIVPVPRELVPDTEIDRLRAVAGRRPMRASQRLI
jgi:hypothetical protein